MDAVKTVLNNVNLYMPYAYAAAGLLLLGALIYLLAGLSSFGRFLKGYTKEIAAVSGKGKQTAETLQTQKQILSKKLGGLGKVIAVFALARFVLRDYQNEKNPPKASLARSVGKAVKNTAYVRKVLH